MSGEFELRRVLRELITLSTLPAVWAEYAPERIVDSLVDLLWRAVDPELLYVRVPDPFGGDVLERARGRGQVQLDAAKLGHALDLVLARGAEAVAIEPFVDVPVTVVRIRLGLGERAGLLAAAFSPPPSDADRVVLGVGANQAAFAIERKWAEIRHQRSLEHARRLQLELEQADRRKDDFLATLAHELRNPLAPLRNALDIFALEGDASPRAEQARRIMERQLARIVRLVDDLLEISRIKRGMVDLRRERLELAGVLAGAIDELRPLAASAEVRLVAALDHGPLVVLGDAARLHQVFANLLANGVKYGTRGGNLWVSARREHADAIVRVRDDGVGIPVDMLRRIFDLFAQAHDGNVRASAGMGIGLAVVRSLVELHGGSVDAHSAGPGTGSEFTIRLPLSSG
jgi:signal transduction histidine kinase